ncbi:MAG: hypothetical protein ACTHJL_13205 [Amnibacterium sp.]
MRRPSVRVLAAAALTALAVTALPEVAFASETGPEPGGSVAIGAVVAAPAHTAAPRVLAPANPPRAAARHAAQTALAPTRTTASEPASTSTPAAKTAKPAAKTPKPTTKPSPTPTKTVTPTTGADVSYPLCSVTAPANQLFGVVGVNGGTARDFNPCLATQFAWAQRTAGTTPQGNASLYINTANPGSQSSGWPTADTHLPALAPPAAGPRLPISTAPVTYPNGGAAGCSSTADPYGPACAYVYGYVRAEQAVQYAQEQLGSDAVATARWWLDTETSTTWAGGSAANAASLAGAATALTRSSSDGVARVGVYSSTAQYTAIVGGTGSAVPALPDGERSPLVGMPEWGAGASNLTGAQSNCGVTPFTGGAITITQYVSGSFDYDVSCRGY